jgi:hypothetical protein
MIDGEDMKIIDGLNENYHTCWDPKTVVYWLELNSANNEY